MAEYLPSKQVVAGSNPVSRSSRLPRPLALPLNSAPKLLARYRLDARARGYSESTIIHTEQCLTFFITFLGGIDDVAAVSADDLRRFIVALRNKNTRDGTYHNLEYIKRLMGHSDIKTTSESYLNVADADLQAAYRLFSPVTNLKAAIKGKAIVSTDTDLTYVKKEASSKQVGQPQSKSLEEQTQLLFVIKELLTKLATDLNATRHPRAESDWLTEKAKSVLQPDYQRLYDNHIQTSTKLVTSLIEDIEHGNFTPANKIWTGPKPAFADLSVVYVAQTERPWPFLIQHLNFEFANPPLEKQIEELAATAFWAKHFRQITVNPLLIASVKEKLILVSERGTLKGTCDICRDYFHDNNR